MPEQLTEPMLINTGGADSPVPVSEAILAGAAPNGELYTYADFPEITYAELIGLRGAAYQVVFDVITKKLLGSAIPNDVLRATTRAAYSPDNFNLGVDGNLRFTTLPSGIHIAGLSDGPTGAFKDMAMQPMARWMSYLQQQRGDPLTIMLATSGDTGPAALSAFSGLPNTEIIAMLPQNGISPFQWAQMAEFSTQDMVHVLEVPKPFSEINDLQRKAEQIYDLGTANSVNIARLIAQIPYHVATYLKAIELEGGEIGNPVDVSVPSGNFGNALSAIIARSMGLPYRNIIVATNENDTLHRLISDGVFQVYESQATDSSAQDISMPSNVWRYFAMLFGNDPEKNQRIFERHVAHEPVVMEDIGIVDRTLQKGILSATIDARGRADVIKRIYRESPVFARIILDPHTANGVAAIEQLGANDPDVPMVAFETAKPFKFEETVKNLIGPKPPRPERFRDLEESQRGTRLDRVNNIVDLLLYLGQQTGAILKQP